MKHVRVRITTQGQAADIHPMFGVMTEAPFVERATALQWNYTGSELGILHYVVGDTAALERAIQKIPEVIAYDIECIDEQSAYIYIRDATTNSLQEMVTPISSGGLVIAPPVEYAPDGTMALSIFGPDDKLQNAIETLSDQVNVTIVKVGGFAGIPAVVETRLTHRQRETIEAALELGYYDIPRTASQEDISAELERAPSTTAEHLRKAESKIIQTHFSR